MNKSLSKALLGALVAGAALLSLSLAACGGFNGIEEAHFSAQRTHPIAVDTDIASMLMEVPRDKIMLSVADKAAVQAFAAAYKQRGHGPLTISAPSGSPNEEAAISIVAGLRAALDEVGVTGPSVGYAPYRASGANDKAPIVPSYRRYVANASECGNWTVDYAFNPRNVTSPNFGCATQNNFAAMVADPADLLGPRDMTPADAQRRGEVLERYRRGDITATERVEEESGAVSEVDQ